MNIFFLHLHAGIRQIKFLVSRPNITHKGDGRLNWGGWLRRDSCDYMEKGVSSALRASLRQQFQSRNLKN